MKTLESTDELSLAGKWAAIVPLALASIGKNLTVNAVQASKGTVDLAQEWVRLCFNELFRSK